MLPGRLTGARLRKGCFFSIGRNARLVLWSLPVLILSLTKKGRTPKILQQVTFYLKRLYDLFVSDRPAEKWAGLQQGGLPAADVLGHEEVDKAIADRAARRDEERRWRREGKPLEPGWLKGGVINCGYPGSMGFASLHPSYGLIGAQQRGSPTPGLSRPCPRSRRHVKCLPAGRLLTP